MSNLPSSWYKRADLRIFCFLLKLFPNEFREEYEYGMVQAFRDQINDTTSKREHITLWLKVFVDIIKNAFQERVNQFSIANHPALADVLWILGFTLLSVFTKRWWISYGQSIFRPLANTPFGQSTWSYFALSAVKGFLIGLSQWVFIRKHIRVNWAWPFVTGIFFSIGGFLSGGIDYFLFSNPDKFRFLCEFYYQANFHSTVQQYLFPIITVYFISLSQVAFLPKSRFRWLWIPVSLIASLVEKYVRTYLSGAFYRVGPFNNWVIFGEITEGLFLAVFLRLLFTLVELEDNSGELTDELPYD